MKQLNDIKKEIRENWDKDLNGKCRNINGERTRVTCPKYARCRFYYLAKQLDSKVTDDWYAERLNELECKQEGEEK